MRKLRLVEDQFPREQEPRSLGELDRLLLQPARVGEARALVRGATGRLHYLRVEHQQRLKAIRSLGMATMPASAPRQYCAILEPDILPPSLEWSPAGLPVSYWTIPLHWSTRYSAVRSVSA